MDTWITISDRALEGMVLAASESFFLGDGSKKPQMRESATKTVETYGFVWGFSHTRYDEDNERTKHIHIDRFHQSLSAHRKRKSVEPDEKDIHLKNSIIERWSPHLSLLGDFHTHPYKSKGEVEENEGWEFSDDDVVSFENDDHLWRLTNDNPLMFVMAVAPIERVHETWGERFRNNCWFFNVGHLRFWLAVEVGYKKKKRKFLKNVYLDLDSRLHNPVGDRLHLPEAK